MFRVILLSYLCLLKTVFALDSVPIFSYGNVRKAPHDNNYDGTKNWELLNHGERFTPRHSHATCLFKCLDNPYELCLWLVGGYSDQYRNWELELENARNDVWFSRDGAKWTQVGELNGDFLKGIGYWDAKPSSTVAPFYSRYGHSLDGLDGDGDGIADVMVLTGGNSPLPSNDVWITRNGRVWNFDGFAPWPKRAYHATVVFQNKLWVLGGTPLSNDVWAGSLAKDLTRDAGYTMIWSQVKANFEAPWAPRAGMCAVSSIHNVNTTSGISQIEELYVIGGLAGYPEGHPLHSDGIRTRNDVWKTVDGEAWEEVLPAKNASSMPWRGRAFHACKNWGSLLDRSRWVKDDSLMHLNKEDLFASDTAPRIFITGGGYMGNKGNNEVRALEAHTDTWWSSDGSLWSRVNYEEGSRYKNNIYSTNEWSEIIIDGKTVYRGKWGHTLESFYSIQDIDLDDKIVSTNVSLNVCTKLDMHSPACKRISAIENRIPTLFVIGGKLEDGPMVSDVFASRQGIHCEKDGVSCGHNGDCGPSTMGCLCYSSNFTGEYCAPVP